jgi:ADP-heptose:LPS heptosyltransferase
MSLVIRAPNHLGDFVMALPALQAAKPDAVVAPKGLSSLIELAGFTPITYEAPISTGLSLRKHKFERGVLFTPSFSSAVLLKLAGVKHRRGTNTDNRGFLLNEKVDAALLAHTHRASVYWLLACGELPPQPLIPRLQIPSAMKTSLQELLPLLDRTKKRIGIFPGSNALARRWHPDRFRDLATRLATDAQVIVFGGPDERDLTKHVAGDVAYDLGGKTSLPLLAAGLASCDVVISNDSGPLHLAAAVGTRTVSLWGAGDPSRTGPPLGHTILRDRRLPCLECVKNQCPRSGPGYILPDAYMECMQLIPVEDVLTSVEV